MKQREIKFRAIPLGQIEYVYGDLIHGVGYKEGKFYILPTTKNLAYLKGCDPLDGFNVCPQSIGQLTGVKDKYGVDIYEGDIIKDSEITYVVKYGEYLQDEYMHTGFYLECPTNAEYLGGFSSIDSAVNEIIGDIYLNPELLK